MTTPDPVSAALRVVDATGFSVRQLTSSRSRSEAYLSTWFLTNSGHPCWSPQVWSLSRGAALLGFVGWSLLRRSSEEPINRGVFHGATAYIALMRLLVLVVAVAL